MIPTIVVPHICLRALWDLMGHQGFSTVWICLDLFCSPTESIVVLAIHRRRVMGLPCFQLALGRQAELEHFRKLFEFIEAPDMVTQE